MLPAEVRGTAPGRLGQPPPFRPRPGAALLLTRLLAGLLFDVGALDPGTYLAMAGVMVGVALIASYNPARRASSVDPVRPLKAE